MEIKNKAAFPNHYYRLIRLTDQRIEFVQEYAGRIFDLDSRCRGNGNIKGGYDSKSAKRSSKITVGLLLLFVNPIIGKHLLSIYPKQGQRNSSLKISGGLYWARTSDPYLVEVVL